jgi:glycosyltransferase involved in cell wall biosynthesis
MEGFGMPQLEALLCGCPVVTAHNTAMIEVAKEKDGAVTVEGYDKEKWIHAIVKMLQERPNVNLQQLSDYHWGNIIDRLTSYLSHTTSHT